MEQNGTTGTIPAMKAEASRCTARFLPGSKRLSRRCRPDKKSLAMAPRKEGQQVQQKWQALEEEALCGKVDPRELQRLAVTVLNADVGGRKLTAQKKKMQPPPLLRPRESHVRDNTP